MAKVYYCTYCKKTVLNHPYHPLCRAEFLEDLCAKVQAALCDTRVAVRLPRTLLELAETLRKERFTSERDSLRAKEEAEDLEHRQRLWELARDEHLQKSIQDWERKHPEPNPPRY